MGEEGIPVLIETLDDVSASCGVTESELRTAVNRELLDNGIRVLDSLSSTTFYVNINTLYFEPVDVCVSNVDIHLSDFVSATPAHSEQEVFGPFLVMDEGSLRSSIRSIHRQVIRDTLSRLAETIAVAIRVANQ